MVYTPSCRYGKKSRILLYRYFVQIYQYKKLLVLLIVYVPFFVVVLQHYSIQYAKLLLEVVAGGACKVAPIFLKQDNRGDCCRPTAEKKSWSPLAPPQKSKISTISSPEAHPLRLLFFSYLVIYPLISSELVHAAVPPSYRQETTVYLIYLCTVVRCASRYICKINSCRVPWTRPGDWVELIGVARNPQLSPS